MATRKRLTKNSNAAVDDWEKNLFGWLNESRNSLQRASATDISTWLVDDLLIKFDRMSMAHSLEGRAPYLAASIVEAGVSLPSSQKMNGEISKVALRRVAIKWLPEKILERPKQGFVLPMASWLAQWFADQPSIKEYFLERSMPELDMPEIIKLVQEDFKVGIQRERFLFAIVLFVEWYQTFEHRRRELGEKLKKADQGTI